MSDFEMVPKIAENIKAIRLRKKLTIKQLAEKTKVTKGLLSKIENSRTIPSLPLFVQILKSLDISILDFFQGINSESQQNYILIRKDELTASTSDGQSGIEYRTIFEKAIPSSTIEISLMNIPRNTSNQSEIISGCRFDHIISGNCEYQMTHNKVLHLRPGDSIFFDGPGAHLPINTSDNDALILVVHFRF